jgi:hypothetical protein
MQYGEQDDNQDLGLNAEEEPSALAYESENAAPVDPDVRDDVQERLKGRAVWESANETGDPTGNEVENGPEVDPNDPNLSATFAEAGAEERQDSIGMLDAEEFALDDPEAEEEP